MGAKDVLTRKTGVIVGDDVLNLFKYAQQKGFAIPAIVGKLAELLNATSLTSAECDLLVDCCGSSRSSSCQECPDHPTDVSRWCSLLCWKGP